MLRKRLALLTGMAALAAATSFGQMAISAKAGMVNHVEGDVYLADQLVAIKFGQFPQLKPEQVLRATDEGRAELILSPGVLLRVAEGASVKMISDKLEDVRLEVLAGSVLVEAVELPKDNKVSLAYKGSEVLIEKPGIYRIDSAQDRLRVYSGEALVRTAKGPILVKGSRELVLGGEFVVAKFDKDDTDSFYRWAARRSEGISMANVSSARMASRSGCGSGCLNSWYYNPYYGMFSYLPGRGVIRSPFGWYMFSPGDAMNLYLPYYYYGPPRPGWNSGGGGGGMQGYTSASRSASDWGGRSGGFGGGGMSGGGGGSYGYTPSAPAASAGAPAAAASSGGTRSGSDGAGRGGSGGGRGQ